MDNPRYLMRQQPIRWGILGAAGIALTRVGPAFHEAGNARMIAAASRDEAKAQDFARQLGIPKAYGSYEALLADPEIDAIYIPLPNHLHAEWAIKAAKASKHVLCEKPLGLNARQVDEMVAAAKEANVLLAEAFMYRFHPQIDWVKDRLAQGAIGSIRLIRAAFSFNIGEGDEGNIRLQAEAGGGGLMDVGCYCVNIARQLLGGEPVEAIATANYGERSRVDETFTGLLRFPSNEILLFDCSLRAAFRQECQVVGSDGVITLPAPFLPGTADAIIHFRHGNESESVRIPGVNHYRLMIEDFSAAILEGRPPRFLPDEGRGNMAALEALAVAARSGHPVRPAKPEPPKPKEEAKEENQKAAEHKI